MEKMSCSELLMRIKNLEFTAVELNLYLDNHPTCQQALNDYNTVTRELMELKKVYEANFGPLCNFGSSPNLNSNSWKWVDEPWPWERGE